MPPPNKHEQRPMAARTSTSSTSPPSTPPLTPTLSPPQRVLERLTPLGKYYSRKNSSDTLVTDDIVEHELRRKSLLDATISRLSLHSSEISDKIDRTKRSRRLRHEQNRKKLDRALRLRACYMERRREIASATIRSIQANGLNRVRPSCGFSQDSFSEPRVGEAVGPAGNIGAQLGAPFVPTGGPIDLHSIPLFAHFSQCYKNMDLHSAFQLLFSLNVLREVASWFEQFRHSIPLCSPFRKHAATYMARIFLYGFTMVVEENYHAKLGRVPSFAVSLEHAESYNVYATMCEQYFVIRRRFLDNYYYSAVVSRLLHTTVSVWSEFEAIVNGRSQADFADHFAEYFDLFQVFRLLHILRSIASVIEANSKLAIHLKYLRAMKKLCEDPVLLAQYDATIAQCQECIKSNDDHSKDFQDQLDKVTNVQAILADETKVYAAYQVDVLRESTLPTGNPFMHAAVSAADSTFGFSVPPTFTLQEWRKCILKVYLEYVQHTGQNREKYIFVRSGRKGTGTGLHKKHNTVQSFSDFAKYTYHPDVEQLRSWLGLHTFDEGCTEAIEHLAALDSVDTMMVDLVQMVQGCLYALGIITRRGGDRMIVCRQGRNYSNIIVLSDAVQALTSIHNGDISTEEYFQAVLDTLGDEVPDFLADECRELLQNTVDPSFVQPFVQLVRDCMIYSVNKSIGKCLGLASRKVLETEGQLMQRSNGDVPLNMRFPVLFSEMHCTPPDRDDNAEDCAYDYFSELFIRLVCSPQLALPELAETFSQQFQALHAEVSSLVVLQSLAVLLMTYFGGDRHKFDFSALMQSLDTLLRDHFSKHTSQPINNPSLKEAVLGVVTLHCQDTSLVDQSTVFSLIDQVAKDSIGSAKSVRSVYSGLMRGILETRGEGLAQFYDLKFLRDRIEAIVEDFYRTYDCLYGAYWDTLKGCYNEFNILTQMGSHS